MQGLQIPFSVQLAEDHTEQLLFDLVGLSKKLTDLNEGGVARSLLESIAIQLEALDGKVFYGIQRAIPLILYTAFGFPLLSAVSATGVATFTRTLGSGDLTIPQNTKLLAPSTPLFGQVIFSTRESVSFPRQQTFIDVPIVADVPGSGGNISAGRIKSLVTPVAGIASVVNYTALFNGTDAETEDAREIRFRRFVTNLARSQLAGLEYAALTAQLLDGGGNVTERVQSAFATEPDNTLGRVSLYVDNGGGSASATLIAKVQQIIDGYFNADGTRVPGYKAAGIVVDVAAIEAVAVDVTLTLAVGSGYVFADVKTAAQAAIEGFFQALGSGGTFILVDLIAAIVSVPGVYDISISTPTENMNADSSQRLLAGTVTITEMT